MSDQIGYQRSAQAGVGTLATKSVFHETMQVQIDSTFKVLHEIHDTVDAISSVLLGGVEPSSPRESPAAQPGVLSTVESFHIDVLGHLTDILRILTTVRNRI